MRARPIVACVFGTRPEAIKMAPVVAALRREPRVRTRVIVTAQHRDMLDDVLRVFRIRPDLDLDIMRPAQSLTDVTVRGFQGLERAFQRLRPDLVLVHGDTTTTLVAGLSAFYQRIPVGHVEAGLRTYDYDHPFPEEMNRRLADALATLHFAPTATSRRALLAERIPPKSVFVTGNTVIDALLTVAGRPHAFSAAGGVGRALKAARGRRIILVTAHRRESWGAPFAGICRALARIASRGDAAVIYPVHPNPNVRRPARAILGRARNVHLLPPLDYPDLVHLMKRAHLVLTDSGGLQEEAPSLGKPVLVMREVTERPEAVRAGTARVVGTREDRIVRETARLLDDDRAWRAMAERVNPYGDGRAAARTVQVILHHFGLRRTRPPDFHP